jgi:hypothetical protein
MNTLISMIVGTGLGIVSMYIFDPLVGRRRRAGVRDKMIRFQKKTKEAAGVTARDLKNRISGLAAEGRSLLFERSIDDEVLMERVRSKLGFLVRHPSAIEVQVTDGRVMLSGPVLSDEVEQLIDGVRSVRGVRDVENRLEVHREPGDVPALQGDKPKPTGQPIDLLQRRWSPSTRFVVGSAGVLLPFLAARNRKAVATMTVVGLGVIAYALTEGNGLSRSGRQARQTGRTEPEPLGGWST